MIRSDRELLADLARINRDMVAFCMRLIDDLATADEQTHYAQHLIAAGERLQRRANEPIEVIIDGEVITNGPVTLPELTTGPDQES